MIGNLLAELVAIMVPVLIAAGIGYGWVKKGKPFDIKLTGTLGAFIATPCLIFSSLTTMDFPLAELGEMALAVFIAIIGMFVGGWAVLRAMNAERRASLISVMLPNMGNMGVPICYFAFGDAGLALAVICMIVMGAVTFSLGLVVVGGRGAWVDLFKLPNMWALAVALVFMLGDIPPPRFVANATELIGGMALPLMLVTLGASVAGFKKARLGEAVLPSVLRFGIGAGSGWLTGLALGLDKVAMGVLILECSMPAAVFNVVLAERYNRDPEKVAGIILITTAASFIVLPVLLSVLLA